MKQHFFVAIPINQLIRQEIEKWKSSIESKVMFKRWVHPQDYHITLAYLGHAEKEALCKLTNKLDEKVKKFPSFSLTLSDIGVFGRKDSPRIFWTGVEKSEPLQQLQKIVVKSCEVAGFEIDSRPYCPHITLARSWNGSEPFSAKHTQLKVDYETWLVDEIILYQTEMDKTPKYKTITKFRF